MFRNGKRRNKTPKDRIDKIANINKSLRVKVSSQSEYSTKLKNKTRSNINNVKKIIFLIRRVK
jgi:predicted house-cleaning noncanonical NTP pyrophosphatase (MazG superfamily)